MKNHIVIINGPTGVGKTAVINRLMKKVKRFNTGVTYTTRPKRVGKKEDKDMRYVSREVFEQKIRNDELLEWAEFSGNYYGLGKKENLDILKKQPLLLNMEWKGTFAIKKQFPDSLSIFVLPESMDQIKARLERKNFTPQELKKRLQAAQESMTKAKKYDYQVVNRENMIDQTVAEIARIIKAYTGKS